MDMTPPQVDLGHAARAWTVRVYPWPRNPSCVTGFFRPSDGGLHHDLRRGVSWPSLGLIAPEDARRFGLAVETASRIVEEMSSVIKDGRVLVRVARREGKTEVCLQVGPYESHLRVEDDKVVMVRQTGLGEFASLFHAWAHKQVEDRATYLRGLSDAEIASLADPYEM